MRAWLELIRLPAVFTAPSDLLAGLALGAVVVDGVWPLGRVALLVMASICIYAAGMAANDLFDADTDARERPARPLPSGRVSVAAVWRMVVGLQLAGVGLAWVGGGTPAGIATAATVAATYLYNGLLKSGPFGPLMMGACRYGNAAIGLAAASAFGATGAVVPASWVVPLGTLLYVAAVTGVSRHEADGLVRWGLRPALVAMPLLALHPVVWVLAGVLPEVLGAAAAVAAPLWLYAPVRRAWHGGPGPVRGAVMAGIFGIPLVNSALAFAAGRPSLALGIVLFALAGKVAAKRFYAT